MRKKSLTRLGVIALLAFSTVTACTISLPSIQTSTSSSDKTNNSSTNQQNTSNNPTNNNSVLPDQINGNLSNKASDANPLGENGITVSSPVPSSSANIASPTPTPTATPSTSIVQGSGQLNLLINPNLPTKRTTP